MSALVSIRKQCPDRDAKEREAEDPVHPSADKEVSRQRPGKTSGHVVGDGGK